MRRLMPDRADAGRPDSGSMPETPTRWFAGAAGEPPVLFDPRRWGSLIGIVGGLVFIFSYTPPLGAVVSIVGAVAGVVLAAIALVTLYVRPRSLGPLRRPSRSALFIYVSCVVAELAAIALGTRLLVSTGHADLRPALIAGIVGAHFVPFAWAFGERLFFFLGSTLVVFGCAGLVIGYLGVPHAAELAAVLSGVAMLALLVVYARGGFTRGRAQLGIDIR